MACGRFLQKFNLVFLQLLHFLRLQLLHFLHAREDVVSDLGAFVGRDKSTFSDQEIINLHEPYLAELVLVKVDFHLHQIIAVDLLKVEADDMAHFEAVLQRALILKLLVIVAELAKVELNLPIERHRAIFLFLFYRLWLTAIKARGIELKSEKLAESNLCHGRQRNTCKLLPVLVTSPLFELIGQVDLWNDLVEIFTAGFEPK